MDAAIAANAALGLMEPTGNGIGGDLFAIVWDPEQEALYGYNGSGAVPRGRILTHSTRGLNSCGRRVDCPRVIPAFPPMAPCR